MKKKFVAVSMGIVFIATVCICFFCVNPQGDTLQSREMLLTSAIAGGHDWTIAREINLDGSIISAAYSTGGQSTLAVFQPTGDGKYKLRTSTNRNNEEIIVGGAAINGKWYDLIWFHGAKTEFAEITYTIHGQTQDPLRYDTDMMDIICLENPEKEYSIHVVYFDSDGNRYE